MADPPRLVAGLTANASGLVTVVPGLVTLAALGVIARLVGSVTPLNPLVLAVAGGVAVAAFAGQPAWARAGIERHKLLLETGIVLLGAEMTIEQLASTGPTVLALAAGVVVVGVLFVEFLGGAIGIAGGIRPLLAAGASVCGVSAVLAVGSSLDSDESVITYAAGTILLFDAVTLAVFPVVGVALGLPDRIFGVWAGLSLFSTGPAVAAGFAVSETAGRWATVTKLVRNTFIGVLAVGYAVRHAAGDGGTNLAEIWTRFPKFLVGFLVVAMVANTSLLDPAARSTVGLASDWLFTLAFVGLGFELNPRQLRATGVGPLGVVLAHFLTMSFLGFVVVTMLL